MERLIITNVTQDNYKEVLARLEELGTKWQGGAKPLGFLKYSSTYGVGLHFPNAITYNVLICDYPTVEKISARDFLKHFKADKIVITRKGRKVTATDQGGNRASARCCPEDEFDFYEGAKLALERLEEKTRGIKAGDTVKVKDYMLSFTSLPVAYFTTDDELRRYVFSVTPRNGQILTVERVGHDGKLYAGASYYDGPSCPLYVIRPEGVERI